MIGKNLSHYEITDLLGSGGMGDVYRARDSRLGRFVALKVLSSTLSQSTELKERFEREARTISNLSHPHVCALYDIGHDDGLDYLVMECLEGETLADRLKAGGAIPASEALRIGVQIADALDTAHRHGVVHRDLKPGNVMLTAAGVKLLDFGLAKPVESGSGSLSGLTAMPTAAADRPLTQEGAILGTLQYMSPEQLEGREVDARSDIFALGLLLYEMITGQRAFAGDSQASLIAAIMSAEPRRISELIPLTPPALERLIKACLVKDPNQRIQSVHDIRLQLEWILEGGGEAPTVEISKSKARTHLGWIVAVMFALMAGGLAVVPMLKTERPVTTTRLSVVPRNLRLVPEPAEIAISPDGKAIAFLAVDSTGQAALWLRTLDALEPTRVAGSDGGHTPFWSPDSRHLAFFRKGKLLRAAIPGGRAPQVICDATDGRGGTWNDDDVIVFAPVSSGPLYAVAASGGVPTQVTTLDESADESAHRFPQFLPDGRHFLYIALVGALRQDTRMASLDGGEPATVITAEGKAEYAAPGYLIFERQNSLLAVRFDAKRGKTIGTPIALADVAGGERDYYGSMGVKAAQNGTIVYIQSESANRLVWLDREGRTQGDIPLPPDEYDFPKLSPDGRRVVVQRPDSENSGDLWMIELSRQALTRLTFEPLDNSTPAWTRDGQVLAFGSRREGTRNIYVKRSGGSSPAELLVKVEGVFANPKEWAPDGRSLLIRDLNPATKNDILIYSLEDQQLKPFLQTRFHEEEPRISHDGRWIAYRSNESGRSEVYVQSFPDLGNKVQVSIGGAGLPAMNRFARLFWGPNDEEIVYLGADGLTMMRVPIEKGSTLRAGRSEPLFKLPDGFTSYESIDNQRWLVCVQEGTQQLTVVTHWAADLKDK